MTTTVASTDIVMSAEPLFTEGERTALAGLLVSYGGLTWDAYALDLRIFTAWCQHHQFAPVPGPASGHRVLRPRHGGAVHVPEHPAKPRASRESARRAVGAEWFRKPATGYIGWCQRSGITASRPNRNRT